MKCEDYPCCGHTPLDPCEPQWYDAPGAFDVSRPGNEHALCDHQAGICEVEEPDPDDDDERHARDRSGDPDYSERAENGEYAAEEELP